MKLVSPVQHCPICQAATEPNPRYPRYVCRDCLSGGVVVGGATVPVRDLDVYFNAFVECEVAGVLCRAQEARFGGVVIEPVGRADVSGSRPEP